MGIFCCCDTNTYLCCMKQLLLFCLGMLLLAGLFSCNKKTPTYSYTCTVYIVDFTTGDTSVYFQQLYTNMDIDAQQMESDLTTANPNNSHNFTKCQ